MFRISMVFFFIISFMISRPLHWANKKADIEQLRLNKTVDTLPKLVDSLTKVLDTLPKVLDTLPKMSDTLTKVADSIPKILDSLPKAGDSIPKAKEELIQFKGKRKPTPTKTKKKKKPLPYIKPMDSVTIRDYRIMYMDESETFVDTSLTIQKEYRFNFLKKDAFELMWTSRWPRRARRPASPAFPQCP